MKYSVLFLLAFFSLNLFSQEEDRPQLQPVLSVEVRAKIIITPPAICDQKIELPDFLIGEQRCFMMPSTESACACLKSDIVLFQTGRKIMESEKYKDRLASYLGKISKEKGYSAANVDKYAAIVEATASGDVEATKEILKSIDNDTEKTLLQKGTDLLRSKDKRIDVASNEYIDYIKKYNDCISFSEFQVVNSLPKKDFIDALNDPSLSPSDFEGTIYGTDGKLKARRSAIKDFMHFNKTWEAAYRKDPESTIENLKKIYAQTDLKNLYKSADKKTRDQLISKIEKEKNAYFRDQKINSNDEKSRKKKRKEYERSVDLLMENSEYVQSNQDLLDRIVRFKGHPSLEECRDPKTSIEACYGTYSNYCIKGKTKQIDPQLERKIEEALEFVDDSQYMITKYKEVTQKYCDMKLRLVPVSDKVSGTIPESMSYLEFKKAYCKEKNITIKGENREFLCSKNQRLVGLFTSEIVDQSLLSHDPQADFSSEFLHRYTNIEINTNDELDDLVQDAIGGSSRGVASAESGESQGVYQRLVDAAKDQKNSLASMFEVDESDSSGQPDIKSFKNSVSPVRDLATNPSVTDELTPSKTNITEHVGQLAGAVLAPEVAKTYALPSFIPAMASHQEVSTQKDVVDDHVKNLESRIDLLTKSQETKAESERQKQIRDLEKELGQLRDFSKSMEKILATKDQENKDKIQGREVASVMAPSPTEPLPVALAPAVNSYGPSRVYEDHFADGSFHSRPPVGQSAMINRQIQESKNGNDALLSVYSHQSVKSLIDGAEASSSGSMILVSSPIEITEGNEGKLSKRELQVEQILIEEIKNNPDRLRSFFEEKKIDHLGLLTLRSKENNQMSYMVRKNDAGKMVIIPVNIARKTRLDNLRRTLQVQAF